MQIIALTIGSALSQLASEHEASFDEFFGSLDGLEADESREASNEEEKASNLSPQPLIGPSSVSIYF